jgi:CMP-N-acetylneuraminic acid synthetase
MKPSVLGAIFARGGSKGIPRKNLRLLAGRPLLAHAINAARKTRCISRVVVSTDDHEIAEVARQHGAEVPFIRPAELAGDSAPEWLSWQHLLRTLEELNDSWHTDILVCVPTTAPLRAVMDIEATIETLLTSDADVVITVTRASRNPYFNMVELVEGYARLTKTTIGGITQRQAAPPVYDIATVAYAARRDFVLSATSIFDGKVKTVEVPAERAIDIDTELDLKFADFLLREAA